MTVYFIGAGPGAADLITLRGMRLIQQCPLVLYAGSLVAEEILGHANESATVLDSSQMVLSDIIQLIKTAQSNDQDVARVHSGDPSLYGAVAEQIRHLEALNINYEIVPGVSAYAAASARIGKELTLPDVSQSIILTRTSRDSSPMPNNEDLKTFAESGATLAIHLSAKNARQIQIDLIPYYGEDCPVVVAYRVTWPDELIIHTTLKDLKRSILKAKITRTALILVGQVLASTSFSDSHLYNPDHKHIFRPFGNSEYSKDDSPK